METKLKTIRKQAGFSQQQVADHLGLKSTNRISRWEAGKAQPSLNNAIQIARLLRNKVEDIFT